MRRLKTVLGILVVLLVAFIVAGYAVLSSLDLESYRGTIEQKAKNATGRDLELAGPMDLSMDFTPAIAVEHVRFANADWGSQDNLATVKRFELEVALLPLLTGEIRIRRLVLIEPRILLETTKEGHGNWVFGAQRGGEAGQGTDSGNGIPDIESILIENGRVTYRDGKTGEEIQLALQRAVLQEESENRVRIEASGGYQTVPFTLSGTTGSLSRLVRGQGRTPIDLRLQLAETTALFDGALDQTTPDLRPDFEVAVSGDQLANLNRIAALGLPAAGPFELKGRVRGEAKGYVLSGLQASVGDSSLSGEGTLKVTGARPALTGQFKSARLNPPQLLQFSESDGSAETSGADVHGKVFPDTPLPVEMLRGFDADITLEVGSLRLGERIGASEIQLDLNLSDGRLEIQPLSGKLGSGDLAVDLIVDAKATPPSVALQVGAERIDYGQLLSELKLNDQISGTLGGRASLKGAGATPHEIASSLEGRIEVTGGKGRIADALLDAAGAGLGEVLSPWSEGQDDMNLNCVVARFDVSKGIAESRAILADTAAITLVGDGSIDLGEEVYDIQLVPKAKQTSLASLAVPMRISGPLDNPTVGPDPLGTAKAGAIAIGTLVNPLATLGALVVESQMTDANPCVEALRKAEQQGSSGGEAAPPADGDGALGGFLEGIGDAIDKQLGTEGNDG